MDLPIDTLGVKSMSHFPRPTDWDLKMNVRIMNLINIRQMLSVVAMDQNQDVKKVSYTVKVFIVHGRSIYYILYNCWESKKVWPFHEAFDEIKRPSDTQFACWKLRWDNIDKLERNMRKMSNWIRCFPICPHWPTFWDVSEIFPCEMRSTSRSPS